MSGPIIRKYGFANFEKIFGERELQHGAGPRPASPPPPTSPDETTKTDPAEKPHPDATGPKP